MKKHGEKLLRNQAKHIVFNNNFADNEVSVVPNIRKILLCIFTASIILMCGCQPTPKNEVVVNKNDGKLEEQINNEYDEEQNLTDESFEIQEIENVNSSSFLYEEELNAGNNSKVYINANVSIPDVTKYPVYKIKTSNFTQKQLQEAVLGLSQGNKIYENDRNMMFKNNLEKELVKLKQILHDIQVNGATSWGLSDIERAIALAENSYATALSKEDWLAQRKEIDVSSLNSDNLEIAFETDDDNIAIMYIKDLTDDKSSRYEASLNYKRKQYPHYVKMPEEFIDIGISEKKAIAVAEETLKSMGIDYMQLSNITLGYESGTGLPDFDTATSFAYNFFYRRTIDDIETPYLSSTAWKTNVAADGDSMDYRALWKSEYINIQVDQNGLAYVSWYNPIEILNKDSQNVKIIDFEEAKKIFEKGIANIVADSYTDIYIEDIKLGYYFIPIKNEMTNYMMIPCWIFYGNDYFKDAQGNVLGSVKPNDYFMLQYPRAQLIINGIDGSII